MISISKKIALAQITALLLVVSPPTIAQEEPSGSMAEIWTVHVASNSVLAFEEAVKAHMAVRQEHGDPFHWETFIPHTGDDLFVYSFRTCCFAWADLDAYEKWAGDNPEVDAHWNENVHPHVTGYEHSYSEIDFANSHWPTEEEGPVRFVGVTTFKLKPGAEQAFNATKAELSQIALNNGWADDHHWAWVTSVNGKPRVGLVIPFSNYADMAPPEQSFAEFLSEQLGSAEAAGAKLAGFSEATYGSSYEIYTHRPDLSSPE